MCHAACHAACQVYWANYKVTIPGQILSFQDAGRLDAGQVIFCMTIDPDAHAKTKIVGLNARVTGMSSKRQYAVPDIGQTADGAGYGCCKSDQCMQLLQQDSKRIVPIWVKV